MGSGHETEHEGRVWAGSWEHSGRATRHRIAKARESALSMAARPLYSALWRPTCLPSSFVGFFPTAQVCCVRYKEIKVLWWTTGNGGVWVRAAKRSGRGAEHGLGAPAAGLCRALGRCGVRGTGHFDTDGMDSSMQPGRSLLHSGLVAGCEQSLVLLATFFRLSVACPTVLQKHEERLRLWPHCSVQMAGGT